MTGTPLPPAISNPKSAAAASAVRGSMGAGLCHAARSATETGRPTCRRPNAPAVPPLGRYDETGRFVLYHDRAEIEDDALDGKAPVIAWAADPVEFFFLQNPGGRAGSSRPKARSSASAMPDRTGANMSASAR